MNKDELLGIYRTSLNNCRLVYASMVLWMYQDTLAFFEELYGQPAIPKPHADLLPMLRDPKVLKIACESLYDTVHRAAMKELFELTKAYCAGSGQMQKLKSQSWFQFWRILRNCFSHDMKFQFSPQDLRILPMSWSHITIDSSLQGKPLTFGKMSRPELLDFLEVTRRFVEVELT